MNKYKLYERNGIACMRKNKSSWMVWGENIAFVVLIVAFAAFMLYIALPAFK